MAEGVPFGNYLIIKRLATGGMAEVFLARSKGDEAAPRIVVLKRMLPILMSDPEVASMFLDEARIAAQLAHPYLIQVFDVGHVDRTLYIAMDYVHGITIADLITAAKAKGTPIPWQLAARLISWVCEALQYAHELKSIDGVPLHLVHRDVTPQNVMLTYNGAPKVVDFGIARAAQRLTTTQPGMLKGKLLYAAPEQYREQDVDARTDLYGAALCLYEMLAGENPFSHCTNPTEAAAAVLGEVPPPLTTLRKDVPRKLAEAVQASLSKAPNARPNSALALRTLIEAVLIDAKAVVGMPELAGFLGTLFPGRAALAPNGEVSPDADTIHTQFEPSNPPREGTQPLDERKRQAILESMGLAGTAEESTDPPDPTARSPAAPPADEPRHEVRDPKPRSSPQLRKHSSAGRQFLLAAAVVIAVGAAALGVYRLVLGYAPARAPAVSRSP